MPRRKQRSPVDEAMEKLVEIHHGNVRKALSAALKAIWAPLDSPLASPTRDPLDFLGALGFLRATQMVVGTITGARAQRALERAAHEFDPDEEKFERQIAALIQEVIDARRGAAQRALGEKSPGRRGMHKAAPEALRAAVRAIRERDLKRHPPNGRRTYSDVCREVATKFGYRPSAKSAKEAAADIKWSDPRRRKRKK
jgi:hypothetical protein